MPASNKIFVTFILFLLCANTTFASTVKTLTLEKGQDLVLPIYLDDDNNSEEIEYLRIPISYNSDYLSPLGFRSDNGILADYTLKERLEIYNKAFVIINGSGVYTQFGQVVEFVLTAKEIGTSTIYLDEIYCNDHSLSGGFWLDNDYFQRVYIEIVEKNRFYISDIEDIIVYEDQPVLPITFSVNIPDENPSGFPYIQIASSNTDVVPQNGMSTRRNDTQYYLSVVPTPNAFGQTEISITVQYNRDQDTQTFLLDVKPVNDAPTFSMPLAITLSETSGPQVFKNWATHISPGAPNEANQELSFIIHVEQPELFYLQPEIDPATGNLQFFPFDNRNGQTQIFVYLQDSGDTLNEGHNLSPRQNCTLTITPFSPTLSDNPVAKLVFISSNQPISLNKITPFIRVMACDANGDAVIMASETQIWLQTESPDSGWFYVMNNDWSWRQSNAIIVIPEGEHSAFFKYRNGRPGRYQIQASEVPDQSWSNAIMSIRVKSDITDIDGDIDGNGQVDMKDVIGEMQYLSK